MIQIQSPRIHPRSRRDARGASAAVAFAAALAACMLCTPPPRATALPLYASREGAACVTCHVDPNGGGIRNDFGFVYLKNRHGMDAEERWSKVTVDPKLNEWITVGLDIRLLYLATHRNGGSTLETSSFLPMEGQVNVAVMPHEHLTLVASHGVSVDNSSLGTGFVARELYGLVEGLPHRMYARAGRFRVPFGLRQDDHTSFVRDLVYLPYDSRRNDAGLELGVIGSRWVAQASFTNGSAPFSERAQTVAAKISRAVRSFQAGVSGFHRYAEFTGVAHDRWAGHGSATRGRVTVLGEYGRGTNEGPSGASNLEAAFAEVDYRASRGLNLRVKWDHADRDLAFSGDRIRRYLVEADLNPMPFTEAKLSWRYYDDEVVGIYKEYVALLTFPF